MRDIEIARPESGVKNSNLGVADLFLAILSQNDAHKSGVSNGALFGRCDHAKNNFWSDIEELKGVVRNLSTKKSSELALNTVSASNFQLEG